MYVEHAVAIGLGHVEKTQPSGKDDIVTCDSLESFEDLLAE